MSSMTGMPRQTRRGPWLPEEDAQLIELVTTQGANNWVRISQQLRYRSPKQCRERYHQNLKSSLNHEPISAQEGERIEQMVAEMGKRWAEIARRLGNRSDNAVKNWWNGNINRRKRNPVHDSAHPYTERVSQKHIDIYHVANHQALYPETSLQAPYIRLPTPQNSYSTQSTLPRAQEPLLSQFHDSLEATRSLRSHPRLPPIFSTQVDRVRRDSEKGYVLPRPSISPTSNEFPDMFPHQREPSLIIDTPSARSGSPSLSDLSRQDNILPGVTIGPSIWRPGGYYAPRGDYRATYPPALAYTTRSPVDTGYDIRNLQESYGNDSRSPIKQRHHSDSRMQLHNIVD